ncbi:glycosyltransferase family 4 protein [Nocardioides kribbensis]|uniref:Glycosyltransferase family 4 protein n=1 Tax=Nocardioides kribbensis TaxID=305517 RepID=A0ABV1NT14_9ACTN
MTVVSSRPGTPLTLPAPSAPGAAGAPAGPRRDPRGPLRIAMIGQRGLPARAGGVERHVEEIATRLAARGHHVTVYCRPGYAERTTRSYHGVHLASLPTVRHAGGEAFVHSALSALVAAGAHLDVVHYHALGPGLFSPLTRSLSRAAVVQTVHGLDDQRDKWGGGAQRVLRAGRTLSAHVPDEVVVVSRALAEHYRDELGRYTTYIGNGVPVVPAADLGLLAGLGLRPGGYVAFVGRLVPEKDPLGLVRAFRDVATDQRLVLVGDSSHTDAYVEQLRAAAALDPRVLLVGYQYGAHLTALQAGATLVAQPSLLEGLPIALLEAAAHARPVVASDIAPHLEILGGSAPGRAVFRAGDGDDLRRVLQSELDRPAATRQAGADQLRADAVRRYDWDVATDLLEAVYRRARARRQGPVGPVGPGAAVRAPALSG